MDAKVVNALLKSVVDTFNKAAGINVAVGKPKLVNQFDQRYSMFTVIGFAGSMEGHLVYGLDSKAAIFVVSKMMGMPYEQLDELAYSAIGEMGNMVGDALAMNLEKLGQKITITPPSVITGQQLRLHVEGVILSLPTTLEGCDCDSSMEIYLVIHSHK
ncbi:MAG: chemotaxis protein CheX [Thermotogota bacterium]|nr:chemotaxis protein CheX [Thermotogota bacterium]